MKLIGWIVVVLVVEGLSAPLEASAKEQGDDKSEKALDKAVSDKAVSNKAVSDKAVSDKAVSDKAVSDKAVSDKAASESGTHDDDDHNHFSWCKGRNDEYDNCLKAGYHGNVCPNLGYPDTMTPQQQSDCPAAEGRVTETSCAYDCPDKFHESDSDAKTKAEIQAEELLDEFGVNRIGHYAQAWKVIKAHQRELHPVFTKDTDAEDFHMKVPCPWTQPPGATQYIFLGGDAMYVDLKAYNWKLSIGWKSGWGQRAPVVGNVLVNCALTGDIINAPISVEKHECSEEGYLEMRIKISGNVPLSVLIGSKLVLREDEVKECSSGFSKLFAENNFSDDMLIKANWLS